jgi:THO complex subunit 1
MDFSARYIFIRPSDEDFDDSKTKDLFDTVIVDDGDVDETAASVGEFIYGGEAEDDETAANGDASMEDAPSVDADADDADDDDDEEEA